MRAIVAISLLQILVISTALAQSMPAKLAGGWTHQPAKQVSGSEGIREVYAGEGKNSLYYVRQASHAQTSFPDWQRAEAAGFLRRYTEKFQYSHTCVSPKFVGMARVEHCTYLINGHQRLVSSAYWEAGGYRQGMRAYNVGEMRALSQAFEEAVADMAK